MSRVRSAIVHLPCLHEQMSEGASDEQRELERQCLSSLLIGSRVRSAIVHLLCLHEQMSEGASDEQRELERQCLSSLLIGSGIRSVRRGIPMEEEKQKSIAFTVRVIHNQIKAVIHKSFPRDGNAPQSQLQGGILGYLYHHREKPVYQRDIEKEFRVSGATATNTLQVMEKNGLIIRKSQDKDARLKRIMMTEPAREKHARVEEHMRLMDERMLQGMTQTEIAELYRLLGKLQENLEQMEAECGIEKQEIP